MELWNCAKFVFHFGNLPILDHKTHPFFINLFYVDYVVDIPQCAQSYVNFDDGIISNGPRWL